MKVSDIHHEPNTVQNILPTSLRHLNGPKHSRRVANTKSKAHKPTALNNNHVSEMYLCTIDSGSSSMQLYIFHTEIL